MNDYQFDSDKHRESTLFFQQALEDMLGRKLTEKEFIKVAWLNGWDIETRYVLLNLFSAVHKAGQQR